MKIIATSLIASLALAFTVRAADVSVKLTEIHMCCDSCVTGAEKAVAKVTGAKVDINKDDEIVTLTAPDMATLQKSVDSLTDAGYFGKSSDPKIKVSMATGATGLKVQKLSISNVHLCCGSCVKAVNKALTAVPGVKETTAKKGATTFDVTGDGFTDKDVFAALQKTGLTGKVAKQ